MSNVICDKEGYSLSLGDRVQVESTFSSDRKGQPFVGEITGFNPLAIYAIRVTESDGKWGWFRRSEVRKLANRTIADAKIKARPFRRA